MSRTTKIRLEPYSLWHVELLYVAAVESQAELFPFLPRCHPGYHVDEARLYVHSQIENFQAGTSFEFAIMSEDGTYLGGCGLNRLDASYRRANLGYWVRSSVTGKGIATAAVQELAGWAWAHSNLNRLEIVVTIENLASCRVAEKAGAEFEGTARCRLMLHEEPHDARIFSLVRPAV